MKKVIYISSILAFLFIPWTYVSADPVVDPSSIKNQDKYYQDNAQCKAIAKDNKGGVGNVA